MTYADVKSEFGEVKRFEVVMPPFWANRGRRDRGSGDEFGPFWANRGRRTVDPGNLNKIAKTIDVDYKNNLQVRTKDYYLYFIGNMIQCGTISK